MELKTYFDPARAEKAHQDTILAGPVIPEGLKAPFDHAWGYLDKPGEMEYHKHYKEEIYFFFKGNGFVRIDGEEMPVAPGSAGQIKIHNVPPKTAAMLMAIVANKMGKPLNELRFISIKEVE